MMTYKFDHFNITGGVREIYYKVEIISPMTMAEAMESDPSFIV